MLIPFIKMHGLENDFVIITEYIVLSPDYVALICDRNKGVGADQLVICRQLLEKNDYVIEMQIFINFTFTLLFDSGFLVDNIKLVLNVTVLLGLKSIKLNN